MKTSYAPAARRLATVERLAVLDAIDAIDDRVHATIFHVGDNARIHLAAYRPLVEQLRRVTYAAVGGRAPLMDLVDHLEDTLYAATRLPIVGGALVNRERVHAVTRAMRRELATIA